ncbi:MAG: WecB/TagA/CpsF family glycosyltransferase [Gammaproteobacteria bacterium]|nr:WecB/TagA/CpsF family glycosyltransferase [Gammaproteobacteria bacterium]
METIDILGYRISAAGLEGDVVAAKGALSGTQALPFFVACANPHSLMVAASDSKFREALSSADLLLPDGAGILLAARMLGVTLRERVAGMEFFLRLSARLNADCGARYFFLGSEEPVLAAINQRIAGEFPNISVAGSYSPPFISSFTPEDNAEMLRRINESGATVLWVGMTAPKQEKWILENRRQLKVRVIGAIGAVFDFYSGRKGRAPKWLRDLGLEWLPRLIREPIRLARRNFISAPAFLLSVLRQRFLGNS